MIDQRIHLAGSSNTIAGLFHEFTESGLANAILELEAASAEATRLAKAAKEEYLHRRRNEIKNAYLEKGDQFGIIHLAEGGRAGVFSIEINTSRRVEWDQEKLAGLQAEIRDAWKADPAEYIDAKLSVKESKYKAWPSDLKAKFEPSRTVKAAAPSLSITLEEKE